MKRLLVSTTAAFGLVFGLSLDFTPSAEAADFLVNTTEDGNDVDPGNGTCEATVSEGDCTLRAAVEEANALFGKDDIAFETNGMGNAKKVYELTLGELDITTNMDILGHGPNNTEIDAANNLDVPCVDNFNTNVTDGRHMTIRSGANVNIRDLTLANGTTEVGTAAGPARCARAKAGACVRVELSTASFDNVHFTNCNAVCTAGVACSIDGGALSSRSGTVTIWGSKLSRNSAADDGGALQNGEQRLETSTMFVMDTELRFNDAVALDGGRGGAIINRQNATLNVGGSTFFMNTSGGLGGAISNRNAGDAGDLMDTVFNNNACFHPTESPCGGAVSGFQFFSTADLTFIHNTPEDTLNVE